MNPQDALALLIGRAILDLHIAKQQLAAKDEQIAELEARIAELDERLATP